MRRDAEDCAAPLTVTVLPVPLQKPKTVSHGGSGPAGRRTDDAYRMMPLQLPGIAAAKAAGRSAVAPRHRPKDPSPRGSYCAIWPKKAHSCPEWREGAKAGEIGLPQPHTKQRDKSGSKRVDLSPPLRALTQHPNTTPSGPSSASKAVGCVCSVKKYRG